MARILALLWPELRLPDADPAPWEPILDALDDLSPRVEPVELGVVLADATGLAPRWGSERRVAARAVTLARGVTPLAVHCGIGDNRWLAALGARLARPATPGAPAALRVLEREELAGLPLDLLPADPATRQRLARFGLTRMAQLAELPRSAIGAQFGAAGERLQDLARGHDPRPLVPRRRPERVEAGAAFEPPIEGVGGIGLTLRRLAAELCDRLAARHLAPGRAVLVLELEDAPSLRVAQVFPQPALEPDWIARLLLSRLESAARLRMSPDADQVGVMQIHRPHRHAAGRETLGKAMPLGVVREGRTAKHSPKDYPIGIWQDPTPREPRVASVRLAFDRLADPATRQLPAFEARAARWEELRWSLERIGHRFGSERLWRARLERPAAALPEHRARLVDIGA